MEFDDIVRITGHICPFVLFSLTLMSFNNLFSAMETILPNFLSPRLDHFCHVPALAGNLTLDQQKDLTIPHDGDSYATCEMYDLPWYDYSEDNWDGRNWTDVDTSIIPQKSCDYGWYYDDTLFTSTATSEWDLVCEKAWIGELMSPLYMSGLFFGSLVSGPLSDNYGRRKTLTMAVSILLISGLMTAFSVNEWMYIVGRFFVALGSRLSAITSVVISMELVTPTYRSTIMSCTRTMYSTGVLAATGLAYAIRDFRMLQLAAAMPMLLMLAAFWLIPESPRWLMSKDRTEEARRSLLTLASRARTTIPPDLIDGYIKKNKQEKKTNPNKSNKELFKNPVLLRWIMILGFLKLASQFVYFGVSLNLDSLFGDIFMNTMLAAITEIPALLTVLYFQQRFGRKKICIIMFSLAGIGGIISAVFLALGKLPMGNTLTLILVRCVASCAVCACTSLSGELFPSYMRQTAVSVTSAMSSAFAIFSPIVGGPLQLVWQPLPSLVFSALSVIAAVLTTLLPECLGKPMPETIEDALNLAREDKSPKRASIGEVPHKSDVNTLPSYKPANSERLDRFKQANPERKDQFILSPQYPGVVVGLQFYPIEPEIPRGVDNWAFEDEFDIRL